MITNKKSYANFVAILSYPFMLMAAFLIMTLGMSLLIKVKSNILVLLLTFLLFVAIVTFLFLWGRNLVKAIRHYKATKVFPFVFHKIK